MQKASASGAMSPLFPFLLHPTLEVSVQLQSALQRRQLRMMPMGPPLYAVGAAEDDGQGGAEHAEHAAAAFANAANAYMHVTSARGAPVARNTPARPSRGCSLTATATLHAQTATSTTA